MWPFKPRPLVVNITAHVAQPGDTVILTVDHVLTKEMRAIVREHIERLEADSGVKYTVFEKGFEISGVRP